MKLQHVLLIYVFLCLLCPNAWSDDKTNNPQVPSLPPFGAPHDKAHATALKNEWLVYARSYLQETRPDYNDRDTILLFDASSNSFISLPRRITKGSRVWLVLVNIDTMHYTYQAQGSIINYGPSALPTALGQIAMAQAPTTTPATQAADSGQPGGEDDQSFTALDRTYGKFTILPSIQLLVHVINAAEIDDALRRAVDIPNSNEARRRQCMEILLSWMKAYASDIQSYFTSLNSQNPSSPAPHPSNKNSFLASQAHLDDIQNVFKFTPAPKEMERAFVPNDPSTAVSGRDVRTFQKIVDDVPLLLTGLNNQLQANSIDFGLDSIDFNTNYTAWTTFFTNELPQAQKVQADAQKVQADAQKVQADAQKVQADAQAIPQDIALLQKDLDVWQKAVIALSTSSGQAGDTSVLKLLKDAITDENDKAKFPAELDIAVKAANRRVDHLTWEDSQVKVRQSNLAVWTQTMTALTSGQQTIASQFADAASIANMLLDANPVGATPAMLVEPFDNVQADDLQVTVTIASNSQQSQRPTSNSNTQNSMNPSGTPAANQGSTQGQATKPGGGGGQPQGNGSGQNQQGSNGSQAQSTAAFAPQTRMIHVDQGWEPMFSAGVAFTTLGSRNYYIAHTPIGGLNSAGTVAQGPTDQFDAGAAAFLHYNYLFTSQWSAGPTIGVTASGTPRFLLGLDLAYGHRDRLIFSGGMAIGSVTELNGVQLGQPPSGTTVNTISATRSGLYFGLSYSFSLP